MDIQVILQLANAGGIAWLLWINYQLMADLDEYRKRDGELINRLLGKVEDQNEQLTSIGAQLAQNGNEAWNSKRADK